MDDIGLLSSYKGIAVHDGWATYFTYNTCHYILCNVHHLRELQGIYDQTNEEWAKDMMDFLLTAKKTKAQVNGQLSAVQLYCGIILFLTQKKNFTCKKHKLCKVIS